MLQAISLWRRPSAVLPLCPLVELEQPVIHLIFLQSYFHRVFFFFILQLFSHPSSHPPSICICAVGEKGADVEKFYFTLLTQDKYSCRCNGRRKILFAPEDSLLPWNSSQHGSTARQIWLRSAQVMRPPQPPSLTCLRGSRKGTTEAERDPDRLSKWEPGLNSTQPRFVTSFTVGGWRRGGTRHSNAATYLSTLSESSEKERLIRVEMQNR